MNEWREPQGDWLAKRGIRRICGSVGWAVNGVIFEFEDGSRGGVLLANNGSQMDINDDDKIYERHGVWTSVNSSGDYIVSISGRQLAHDFLPYFCYSLVLEFASGRHISYTSTHWSWEGRRFEFRPDSDSPFFVSKLVFRQYHGILGIDGHHTSAHLPVRLSLAPRLPPQAKAKLLLVFQISQRISLEMVAAGMGHVPKDIWWQQVFGYLVGFDL